MQRPISLVLLQLLFAGGLTYGQNPETTTGFSSAVQNQLAKMADECEADRTQLKADLEEQAKKIDEAIKRRDSEPSTPGPEATVEKSSLWRDKTIYVYWENANPSQLHKECEWVKQAVLRTWQKESALKFEGWSAAKP